MPRLCPLKKIQLKNIHKKTHILPYQSWGATCFFLRHPLIGSICFFIYLFRLLQIKIDVDEIRVRKERKNPLRPVWSVVNLSFSFRTPSTSSYLLVGVNERGQEKTEDYQPWKRELIYIFLLVDKKDICSRWLVFFLSPDLLSRLLYQLGEYMKNQKLAERIKKS